MASVMDFFKRRKMNGLYITAGPDHTWSASVKSQKGSDPRFKLTEEQEYPVNVYYRRTDFNGSSVYEMDVCLNRNDLLSSLNWIGQSRNTIVSLWDYKAGERISEELSGIFNEASSYRWQLEQEAAAESLSDLKMDPSLSDDSVWITVYKDTLGFQDDHDNLTEICVPTDWLCNILRSEGEEPDAWFLEYTADHTMNIAEKALKEGIISGCSDPRIKIPAPKDVSNAARKEPLTHQITASHKKAFAVSVKNGPAKEIQRL